MTSLHSDIVSDIIQLKPLFLGKLSCEANMTRNVSCPVRGISDDVRMMREGRDAENAGSTTARSGATCYRIVAGEKPN